jgi:hypothetical protein
MPPSHWKRGERCGQGRKAKHSGRNIYCPLSSKLEQYCKCGGERCGTTSLSCDVEPVSCYAVNRRSLVTTDRPRSVRPALCFLAPDDSRIVIRRTSSTPVLPHSCLSGHPDFVSLPGDLKRHKFHAQIVHLLYKIVIFGGYILHPLHPLHIRYAHLKPSIFWRLGVGEDQSFFS